MLNELEINQRWIKLLTAHGVKFELPDKDAPKQQRWAIGFCCNENLPDAYVDEHLVQMFEAVKRTREEERIELTDIRAMNLEFQDDVSNNKVRLAVGVFYTPIPPRVAKM